MQAMTKKQKSLKRVSIVSFKLIEELRESADKFETKLALKAAILDLLEGNFDGGEIKALRIDFENTR